MVNAWGWLVAELHHAIGDFFSPRPSPLTAKLPSFHVKHLPCHQHINVTGKHLQFQSCFFGVIGMLEMQLHALLTFLLTT